MEYAFIQLWGEAGASYSNKQTSAGGVRQVSLIVFERKSEEGELFGCRKSPPLFSSAKINNIHVQHGMTPTLDADGV